MKKFLFPILFLPLFVQAQTQETPSNWSISIVGGPNWADQSGKFVGDAPKATTGYNIGFDAARKVSAHWQLKLGVRYSVWNATKLSGFLTYESEYSTGQYVYDPSLPHYVTLKLKDKVWFVMPGLRWIGSGQSFRSFADLEFGLASIVGTKSKLFPTIGAMYGMEWNPGKHFGVFVSPGARLTVITDSYVSKVFVPHVEAGGRYRF